MNWKKLILLGILFWVIVFVVWIIMGYIPGLTTAWEWVIAAVVAAVAIFLLAKWYFKSAEGDFGKGLLFGLGALVIANILDAAVTIPFVAEGDYGVFYGKWELWVSFVIVLVFAGLGGLKKGEGVTPVGTGGMNQETEVK